ncbi:hypothetical protein FKM82_027450 [Ascaphus truei]
MSQNFSSRETEERAYLCNIVVEKVTGFRNVLNVREEWSVTPRQRAWATGLMIVLPTVMWKEVVGPGMGGSMRSSVIAMLSLSRRRAIQDDITERHS